MAPALICCAPATTDRAAPHTEHPRAPAQRARRPPHLPLARRSGSQTSGQWLRGAPGCSRARVGASVRELVGVEPSLAWPCRLRGRWTASWAGNGPWRAGPSRAPLRPAGPGRPARPAPVGRSKAAPSRGRPGAARQWQRQGRKLSPRRGPHRRSPRAGPCTCSWAGPRPKAVRSPWLVAGPSCPWEAAPSLSWQASPCEGPLQARSPQWTQEGAMTMTHSTVLPTHQGVVAHADSKGTAAAAACLVGRPPRQPIWQLRPCRHHPRLPAYLAAPSLPTFPFPSPSPPACASRLVLHFPAGAAGAGGHCSPLVGVLRADPEATWPPSALEAL